jgi:hypothetical protein
MYNLGEAVGGYAVLVPATTMALGSTGGVAAGFNVTSTGTAQLNFNGIVKALTAFTNTVAIYLPAVQTQTYQQQIAPKNLAPSQQCSVVIMCDDAATPNLYWVQGVVVDASQTSRPVPPPQGAINTAGTTTPFNLPQQVTGLVPLLYFTLATTGAQAYQFPGGLALPTLTGVTNYQYTYASLTAPTQTVLCNWPANSL